jgi:hypothetical protein
MNMKDYLELFKEYNQAMQLYGQHSYEAQHIYYKLEQCWKELTQEEKVILSRNGAHL